MGVHMPEKKPRGFAGMDREKVRELARQGGVAAHRTGRAHEFTRETARVAGAKGGKVMQANKKAAKVVPETPA